MRIQRFRFCNQDWNWSRSSFPGSDLSARDGPGPLGSDPKKSSKDTAASAFCSGAGTAGGTGSPSSPSSKALPPFRPELAAMSPLLGKRRADNNARKKAPTDCPLVSRARYWRLGGSGVIHSGSADPDAGGSTAAAGAAAIAGGRSSMGAEVASTPATTSSPGSESSFDGPACLGSASLAATDLRSSEASGTLNSELPETSSNTSSLVSTPNPPIASSGGWNSALISPARGRTSSSEAEGAGSGAGSGSAAAATGSGAG